MKKNKSQAWKHAEKKVAKTLKGKRNHRVVLQVFDKMPDIDHFILIPEVKHGYVFPKYLDEWFKEAESYNKDGKKITCVVWGAKGKRTKDKLVLIKLDEFGKLLNKIEELNQYSIKNELKKYISKFSKFLSDSDKTIKEIEKEL